MDRSEKLNTFNAVLTGLLANPENNLLAAQAEEEGQKQHAKTIVQSAGVYLDAVDEYLKNKELD